jgi:hypothetical protein
MPWIRLLASIHGACTSLAPFKKSSIEFKGYIATTSKVRRTGSLFLDLLRSGRGATPVAPDSPRGPDPGPGVFAARRSLRASIVEVASSRGGS